MSSPEMHSFEQVPLDKGIPVMLDFGITQGIIEQLADKDNIDAAIHLAELCVALRDDGAPPFAIDAFAIGYVVNLDPKIHEDAQFVQFITQDDFDTKI